MAAPTQTQLDAETTTAQTGRPTHREQAWRVLPAVLAIVITLFAVLNLKSVKVDWIVGSGHPPLIVVIVISLLVGVVLGRFAARRSGRRR